MTKSTLLFDFTVDKKNNTIAVKKEFAAHLWLVWDAFTKAEILDRWWAPKPWKARTKSLEFKEGGTWLYAMVGPNNEEHWCRADYKNIFPMRTFGWLDAFCDANGKMNPDFPRTNWKLDFQAGDETTRVSILLSYASLADLEKIMELGMKEGFTMALQGLDALIEQKAIGQ